jgi:hypothetical protein
MLAGRVSAFIPRCQVGFGRMAVPSGREFVTPVGTRRPAGWVTPSCVRMARGWSR